jgi:hypothetical protein
MEEADETEPMSTAEHHRLCHRFESRQALAMLFIELSGYIERAPVRLISIEDSIEFGLERKEDLGREEETINPDWQGQDIVDNREKHAGKQQKDRRGEHDVDQNQSKQEVVEYRRPQKDNYRSDETSTTRTTRGRGRQIRDPHEECHPTTESRMKESGNIMLSEVNSRCSHHCPQLTRAMLDRKANRS